MALGNEIYRFCTKFSHCSFQKGEKLLIIAARRKPTLFQFDKSESFPPLFFRSNNAHHFAWLVARAPKRKTRHLQILDRQGEIDDTLKLMTK